MEKPLRKIYNPVQKDYVTFLQTHEDTGGKMTKVEVELSSGGGVGVHFHKTYSETFEVLEGNLKIQLDTAIHSLFKGQSAKAEPYIIHRFFNDSSTSCTFNVCLEPASKGFEQALQVGYGLARDGQTNKKGMPRNPLVLAWLFDISESNLPGWRSIFEGILRWQAKRAVMKGIDKELLKKYVTF
jgi:quercetin dioxygenase-like cupin family protein